jgi:hypothetical protein
MSMPGFDYRLVCHACGVRSPLYPLDADDMHDTRVVLPGWSRVGRRFLEVIAVLCIVSPIAAQNRVESSGPSVPEIRRLPIPGA